MRAELRYRVAGVLGQAVLDTILATTRFEVERPEDYQRRRQARDPVILVCWHGRLLPLTYLHRREGVASLISQSADGEYIARVLRRWGFLTVRGSSTRGGGRALRELTRLARAGHSLAFTPDGPRGPRQRMKPGAIAAAQLTGLPLVPLTAAADRAWWFESWDRFLVPRPFARVRVRYGTLHRVARDADEAELEASARAVEAELNHLTALVDAEVAG